MWYQNIIDRNLLPDSILRILVRYGLSRYSIKIQKLNDQQIKINRDKFLKKSLSGPIALNTDKANLQHYELPTEFFKLILGERMKYSGSIWNETIQNIDFAEELTLKTYIERSDIKDGHKILDLGTGWGALSIYLAENCPNSEITAVTNSTTQKKFIESECNKRNINNLSVLKSDVNNVTFDCKFDRIFSIEMLEHTRNTKKLLNRVSNWMFDNSNFFIQVFAHKFYPQYFDDVQNSWMAKYFFSSGMMPYPELYKDVDSKLIPVKSWFESGKNYHKTLEAWLNRFDMNSDVINSYLKTQNLTDKSKTLMNRFRFFLVICSELFNYNQGNDWIILNQLFNKKTGTSN